MFTFSGKHSWVHIEPIVDLIRLKASNEAVSVLDRIRNTLSTSWMASAVNVVIERMMTHRGRGLSISKRTSLSTCATTKIEHGYRIDHITVVRRPSHMGFTLRFLLEERKMKQMRRSRTRTMLKISSLCTSIIVNRIAVFVYFSHGSRA